MFVDMILVRMVQMAIVKVVHMAVVPNRGVPTVWAMPMGVVGMVLLSASGHDFSRAAGGEDVHRHSPVFFGHPRQPGRPSQKPLPHTAVSLTVVI